MNVLLTTGSDGVLTVHRENCKRLAGKETQSVSDYLGVDPGALTTAKKASCCKPTDATMGDIESAAWDELENAANAGATLDVQQNDDGIGSYDEDGHPELDDLIGVAEPEKPEVKKVAKELSGTKVHDGAASLEKVVNYIGVDPGNLKFPGFGRGYKTPGKQTVYINSRGSADVRASSPAEAESFATLPGVERRSGNYVRVNLAAI